MTLKIATILTLAAVATGAFAEGDAEAGKKVFGKCKSCHMVQDADGTDIVKGGRTGPNLYGIIGRTAGTYEGFNYGADIVAAGAAGLVWDEESFEAYIQDPKGFLAEYLDKGNAKSNMSFRLKSGMEDVYAYLVSVGPAAQ
ncbi:c-type cytochrome [Tropicibacter sp. S64]|uniref:c-type cytochrome n=1 Tax=Tropicibacter sp. S64 TaxID=3415122 RepID=UPI003C7CA54D